MNSTILVIDEDNIICVTDMAVFHSRLLMVDVILPAPIKTVSIKVRFDKDGKKD